MADSFASHLREALALERRVAPEFYTTAADVEPGAHREAICFALSDLGLAGIFCIEGVPTVAFLNEPDAPLARIDELHRILWNQGLMSLQLVLKEDELVAYSLVQRPFERQERQRTDPRVIATLSLLSDALKLRELIDATESGRFWFENDKFFDRTIALIAFCCRTCWKRSAICVTTLAARPPIRPRPPLWELF